jgi:hypothetical protein
VGDGERGWKRTNERGERDDFRGRGKKNGGEKTSETWETREREGDTEFRFPPVTGACQK